MDLSYHNKYLKYKKKYIDLKKFSNKNLPLKYFNHTGGADKAELNLLDQLFGHDPVHHLGHYLDRYGFAALETVSPGMRENLRMIIRTRNQKLPVEKQMANLKVPFSVSVVLKKLLQIEERHPLDIIATGGYNDLDGKIVNTVMSLDLVTKQYTTLAPMITARNSHASAMLDGKLFVLGGGIQSRSFVQRGVPGPGDRAVVRDGAHDHTSGKSRCSSA